MKFRVLKAGRCAESGPRWGWIAEYRLVFPTRLGADCVFRERGVLIAVIGTLDASFGGSMIESLCELVILMLAFLQKAHPREHVKRY